MEDKDGFYQEQHALHFSENNFFELVKDVFSFVFPGEIPAFFAVFISLLGISEVVTKDLKISNVFEVLLPALIISLVVVIYRGVSAYIAYCPEELMLEGDEVKKIYKRKKIGWQYAMALLMISSRINVHRRSIERLARKAEYVAPMHLDLHDYIQWGRRRTDVIIRLINSVTIQFVHELPKIVSDLDGTVSLADFKLQINYLGDLYKEIRDFEMDSHRVLPPDGFDEAHSLTHGWARPVEKAVDDFLQFLREIEKLDVKSLKAGTAQLPHISIVVEPVGYLDDYMQALGDAVDKHIASEVAEG